MCPLEKPNNIVPEAAPPSIIDFQYAYLASGIAGLLSLILTLGVLRGDKPSSDGRGLNEAFSKFISGIKEVVSDTRVAVTSAMEGLQNMTVGALEAFLPICAVKIAGLNEFQAGVLWVVHVITTILSKPIMGKTSDKYGRKALVTVGLLMCAVSFGLIQVFKGFCLLMITAAFFGLGEALVTSSGAPLWLTFAKRSILEQPWVTFGTIFDIGHAAGPVLAGFLLARHDYLFSFWVIAAILLTALPIFVLTVQVKEDVSRA